VLVGQIRNVSTNSMRLSYKVDDGTGVIDVNRFLGDEKTAFEDGTLTTLPQDTYIKAFGRLKEFGTTRQVLALIIRPIEDHNEISCHLLESTLVHLQTSRGLPSKDGGKPGAGAHGDHMDVDGGTGNGTDNGKNLSSLSVNAKKVYQYIEEAKQSHEGVHLQQIAQGLHMELNQVQKGGNELLDKGLIYSTVDEDTWAPLEM
jgi:replication factor A2